MFLESLVMKNIGEYPSKEKDPSLIYTEKA